MTRINEQTRAAHDPRDRERTLWVNVILTAIRDATVGFSGESTPTRERDRRAARAWFRPSNRDFIQVCNLAGMEPSRVAKQATDAIARYDATGKLWPKQAASGSDRQWSLADA